MRRIAALVLLPGLLAACGGVALKSVPSAQAASLAVHVSDLPSGWAVDSESHGSITCRSIEPFIATQAPHLTSSYVADYAMGDSGPDFEEAVFVYKGASVETGYDALIERYDKCKTFTVTEDGQTSKGAVGRMSLNSYGDQSVAFQVSYDYYGLTAAEDEVVIRKGDVVIDALYGDNDLDITTAERFFAQAVGNLP